MAGDAGVGSDAGGVSGPNAPSPARNCKSAEGLIDPSPFDTWEWSKKLADGLCSGLFFRPFAKLNGWLSIGIEGQELFDSIGKCAMVVDGGGEGGMAVASSCADGFPRMAESMEYSMLAAVESKG